MRVESSISACKKKKQDKCCFTVDAFMKHCICNVFWVSIVLGQELLLVRGVSVALKMMHLICGQKDWEGQSCF